MYQWICEKCGDQNRSSQNICKNTACRFVFHGTKEQTVVCAKCKTAPVGNSLFRKGRNTTFPLMKLSPGELSSPDYLVYGEAGRKFLNELRPFVGRYLCQSCHPFTIGLKIDSSIESEYGVADTDKPEMGRVFGRIRDDRNAYDRVAKELKEKVKKIKAANPEMTEQEEIELARRLIRRVKDDEFLVDKLDWQLRRIVRGAIVSKISFRKNISKDRIYEKLYRYWRIEEARQGHDMSHLKKVLKQEARRASELGQELMEDARKGPDLFSTIEELTRIMADKSDEIALREHRIRNESKMAHKLDVRMTVLYSRIGKLQRAMHDTSDSAYMARLGPILTRLQSKYFDATDRAQRYLTPIGIEMEHEIIRKMQRRFFTHYAPLLNVARGIIFWDIKEDMWKGPDGMTEAQKDQAGYGKYFSLPEHTDRTKFGKGFGYQDVTFRGYKPVNEKASDKEIADGVVTSHQGLDYEETLGLLAQVNVYSVIRCEICDRLTSTPMMLFGMNAVRRIDAWTGQDAKPKVEDFVQKNLLFGLSKEDQKKFTRMDLLVCPSCHEATSLTELAKAQTERRSRLQAEWQEKAEEKRQEGLRLDLEGKIRRRMLSSWLLDALFEAREDLRMRGVEYLAPIKKIDLRIGGKIKLMMVVVPKLGIEIPERLEKHGWSIEIIQTQSRYFPMSYAYHMMVPKELSKWSISASKKGMTLTRMGLINPNYRISEVKDVALYLGFEVPAMPMGYWKGIYTLGGMKEVHPNFRDLVVAGSEFDFELMYPYGKPKEAEVLRQKAVKMDLSRRRSEERKFWDPLRTRGKGGPSPKNIPVKNRPPAREDLRGFHKETPMGLSPAGLEEIRKKGNPDFELKVWEVKDPATKETKDFLMLPPLATPEKGRRHYTSEEEVKEFYRQKAVGRGQGGADDQVRKKWQEECDAKIRRYDRKTYQHVRLPKKQ